MMSMKDDPNANRAAACDAPAPGEHTMSMSLIRGNKTIADKVTSCRTSVYSNSAASLCAKKSLDDTRPLSFPLSLQYIGPNDALAVIS